MLITSLGHQTSSEPTRFDFHVNDIRLATELAGLAAQEFILASIDNRLNVLA